MLRERLLFPVLLGIFALPVISVALSLWQHEQAQAAAWEKWRNETVAITRQVEELKQRVITAEKRLAQLVEVLRQHQKLFEQQEGLNTTILAITDELRDKHE